MSPAAITFVSLIILLLSSSKTTSSSSSNGGEIGRSRSIDRAVDINATNFDSTFKEAPAAFAIVEFFAHWLHHYEKVASLFNGPDAVHPGIVLMTRVDCALKINYKLCENFSVSHFPMLFWGPPSKFVSGHWKSKQEKSDIRVIDDGRTDQRLLNWINKQVDSSYALADRKFENENIAKSINGSEQIENQGYAAMMK
ncbi:hypothetical protein ACFE04_030747 [Oxalis oulophora]